VGLLLLPVDAPTLPTLAEESMTLGSLLVLILVVVLIVVLIRALL
jgi:small-conductance mechanosensitive channel